MQDQSTIQAKLLIGADGANSWVRTQANMEFENQDYGHTAIVATVTTELSHQATAWQRFLSTGPLAFLPLSDPYRCSIVWSAEHDYAKELLLLDDEKFCYSIAHAFDKKLGDITTATSRHHFPLQKRQVKNYIRPHLALIGDAAHTIHPLAGQGMNLGLLDAVALAEIILDARRKNRDFSNLATLRRYERWRKSDMLLFYTCIDGLKQLFGSDNTTLTRARNAGLDFVNRASWVKNLFMHYALGNRSDLPRLALEVLDIDLARRA